jgi:hypothetical protein
MKLEQQFQNLINEAPQYGVPAEIMELGVVPILKLYAEQLAHQQYYLRQTLNDNLLMTILTSKDNPEIEKKVVYAFPSVKDAAQFQDNQDPEIVAKAFPTGQILFQMFNMKEVDSVVFIEQPNDLKQTKEINCKDFQNAIQQQLKKLVSPNSPPNNIA